jgi:hypothetical protein
MAFGPQAAVSSRGHARRSVPTHSPRHGMSRAVLTPLRLRGRAIGGSGCACTAVGSGRFRVPAVTILGVDRPIRPGRRCQSVQKSRHSTGHRVGSDWGIDRPQSEVQAKFSGSVHRLLHSILTMYLENTTHLPGFGFRSTYSLASRIRAWMTFWSCVAPCGTGSARLRCFIDGSGGRHSSGVRGPGDLPQGIEPRAFLFHPTGSDRLGAADRLDGRLAPGLDIGEAFQTVAIVLEGMIDLDDGVGIEAVEAGPER